MSRDPYAGFNFRIEIEGLTIAGFSEVSGLQAEIEVEDYREGGQNEFVHRIAGPTKYPNNLILKHGISDVNELWEWHRQATRGKIERREVIIVLRDNAGNDVRSWVAKEAYPVRWVGPELRASTAEVAVESVELAHSGITS